MASEVVSKSAPTGGWNTIDALAAMPPGDAIIMDNWFPNTSGVTTRSGYRVHTTGGMGSLPVETLLTYAGATGSKMFAFANNKIYEVTTFNTTATDVTAGSAITSNRWQGLQFGGFLIAFNGADVPRKYDGSVWTDAVYTGSGLTPTNLIHINAYRSRLYLVEKDTLTYWYGGTNLVTGALIAVDLSTIFQRGGYLVATATWTRDSGNGPDDYFVALSSTGEYLLYLGSDPSNSDWTIVGRFQMGAPISRRCFARVGPELVVACQDGLVPLTKAMSRGQVDDGANSAISAKIQPTFTQAASSYESNFGWEVMLYPLGSYLLVNVPLQNSGSVVNAQQYVVNTKTGAWCRYVGQNAICWTLFNNLPYFGTAVGTVMQADYGFSDGSTGVVQSNGALIAYDVKSAFDYYGQPRGQQKQFQMVRPLISANGPMTLTLDQQVDYEDAAIHTTVSSGGAGTPWGSPWGSPWGDSMQVNRDWFGTEAIGYCAALRVGVSSKTQRMTFTAYDVMFERGGFV